MSNQTDIPDVPPDLDAHPITSQIAWWYHCGDQMPPGRLRATCYGRAINLRAQHDLQTARAKRKPQSNPTRTKP